MDKFTIFTIILSVSVVTVMSDLVVRDYFGEQPAATSVLTSFSEPPASDIAKASPAPILQPETPSGTPPAPVGQTAPTPPIDPPSVSPSGAPSGSSDPSAIPVTPTVTESRVHSAGFTGTFLEKQFSGKVYQLLDITNIPVDAVGYYEVAQDRGVPVISVTEITLRDEIRALQLYALLQNKTKPYIDLSLNETNAYGDRSFYINHAKKPEEAFLTIKVGRTIYAFAYLKLYHPELKKFIFILTA